MDRGFAHLDYKYMPGSNLAIAPDSQSAGAPVHISPELHPRTVPRVRLSLRSLAWAGIRWTPIRARGSWRRANAVFWCPQRVLDGHRRLVRHTDDCQYIRSATGRIVAYRKTHAYGTAFAWAQKVLIGARGTEMSSDDRALFDEAVRANQDAGDFRRRLAARHDEIRD